MRLCRWSLQKVERVIMGLTAKSNRRKQRVLVAVNDIVQFFSYGAHKNTSATFTAMLPLPALQLSGGSGLSTTVEILDVELLAIVNWPPDKSGSAVRDVSEYVEILQLCGVCKTLLVV